MIRQNLIAAAAALAGLGLALAGLGGLWALHGAAEATAAEARHDDWRPPCVRSLAPAYRDLDAVIDAPPAAPSRTYLFGVDLSGSNRDAAAPQLAAALDFAKTAPLGDAVGVLLISDRSDRSSTPDMPLEAAVDLPRHRAPPLPCAPECRPRSLFERQCLEKLDRALAERVAARDAEADAAAAAARAARAARVDAWAAGLADYAPRPGTSLLAFFAKVADLPAVRRASGRVTLVVLSDLEEARTPERRLLDAFDRAYRAAGDACPAAAEGLPTGLAGVDVLLLQTHTDGVDAERWGARWEALLACAGARVERRRYSPAVALADYLAL